MIDDITRRSFVQGLAALGASSTLHLQANAHEPVNEQVVLVEDRFPIEDRGWSLWLDHVADWEGDEIFLPGEFELGRLNVNPPTGGWQSLYERKSGDGFASVDLPATVEQLFWGHAGKQPYSPDEYRYAADDPVPQNGAYRGVSWFWRFIDIPASMTGKRILLQVRSARMRAEVYLNEKLVGYSSWKNCRLSVT